MVTKNVFFNVLVSLLFFGGLFALAAKSYRAAIQKDTAIDNFAAKNDWQKFTGPKIDSSLILPDWIIGMYPEPDLIRAYELSADNVKGIFYIYEDLTNSQYAVNRPFTDPARRILMFQIPTKELEYADVISKDLKSRVQRSIRPYLQVEGNFNKDFDIFVLPHKQREALEILSPEVLALMLDYGRNLNVEIRKNHIVVFKDLVPNTEITKEMQAIFTYGLKLRNEIDRK